MPSPKTFLLAAFLASATACRAQSEASQQLAFDIEKLAQFKQTLSKMYEGYHVVSSGYSKVKDATQGHYSLSKAFLDQLMAVSPVVRNYRRVGDIVTTELGILKESRAAMKTFTHGKVFTPQELNYISGVYKGISERSATDLDALVTVVTAGNLRMTDAERLKEIDRIWGEVSDKYAFIHSFDTQTLILGKNRAREMGDIATMTRLSGSQLK